MSQMSLEVNRQEERKDELSRNKSLWASFIVPLVKYPQHLETTCYCLSLLNKLVDFFSYTEGKFLVISVLLFLVSVYRRHQCHVSFSHIYCFSFGKFHLSIILLCMCCLGRECICALVQVVRHLSGVIICFHLLMCTLGSSQQTSVLSTKMHNYSQQGGYFLASSRCCLLLVHLDIHYFTLHHECFCFDLQRAFFCVHACMYMCESIHCMCVFMCVCACGVWFLSWFVWIIVTVL